MDLVGLVLGNATQRRVDHPACARVLAMHRGVGGVLGPFTCGFRAGEDGERVGVSETGVAAAGKVSRAGRWQRLSAECAAHPSTFFNRLGEPITRRDAMRATRSAVGTSQHAAKPRYVCSMYQTVITTEYAQQSPTILDTDVPATTALGHVRGSRTDPSGALSRRDSRRGRHRPLRAGCDGGR